MNIWKIPAERTARRSLKVSDRNEQLESMENSVGARAVRSEALSEASCPQSRFKVLHGTIIERFATKETP